MGTIYKGAVLRLSHESDETPISQQQYRSYTRIETAEVHASHRKDIPAAKPLSRATIREPRQRA